MSTTLERIVVIGLLFLVIFPLGFILSRSGKPYNQILFNIHKLATLGAITFLIVTIIRVNQATPLETIHIAAIVLTAVCFLINIATGGLMSIEKEFPSIIHTIHQIVPYPTVLSTAGLLYLLLIKTTS